MPSDTIYGLSCRALGEVAVERLHKLKDRSAGKPFIILISNIKMLDLLSISKSQAEPAFKYWPGALSAILESKAPKFLTLNTNSLAVRMPNQPDLLKLIDKVGPIVSTSANLEGGKPAQSVAEAKSIFADKLDFYVDVGPLDGSQSTLAALKDGRLEVIRQGAVRIN